ncbi:MAG TPA: hypothetical protein VFS00_14265, partial [Polyangiaceae bacterium]|nr:hypothetical protein [Polyangiaceae bacterium]
MPDRPPGARRVGRALAAIARAGCAAGSLRAYRARVLAAVADVVPYDAAIFHALSPRVPLATAVVVGLDPARVEASRGSWDDVAVELEPRRARADARLV